MNINSDPTIIHETVLRDIVSLIASEDGTFSPDKMAERMFGKQRNNFSYKNIAKVAKDLTLTFPVIVSDSVSVETASMLTKAIERKAVGMLQMLFSAIEVTNATNAFDYLHQFHTNLNKDSNMGVDDWIEIGNTLINNEEFEQYAGYSIDEMNEINPSEYILDEDGRLESAIKAAHDKLGIGYDKIRSMALNALGRSKNVVHATQAKTAKTVNNGMKTVKTTVKDAKTSAEIGTDNVKKELDDAIESVIRSANSTKKSANDRIEAALRKVRGIPENTKKTVVKNAKSLKEKLIEAHELAEDCGIKITDEELFEEAISQFIEMGDFYLEETYSERSLNDYSVNMNYGTVVEKAIVKEEVKPVRNIKEEDLVTEDALDKFTINSFVNKENSLSSALNEADSDDIDKRIEALRQVMKDAKTKNKDRNNAEKELNTLLNIKRSDLDIKKYNDMSNNQVKKVSDINKIRKDISDALNNNYNMFSKQIIPSDVQKANELVPTMMIIRFVSTNKNGEGDSLAPIESSAVVGVKAKLQYVSSADMLDRLVSKNEDKNGLFNFIKATTGQISFLKDFVFAIQKAKIDSIASSGKGSSSPIWKMLEHRALMSKFRRFTGTINDAAAISTLVISKEEADHLKKYERMDLKRVSTVNNIMNAYNVMGFVVVDETLEKANFLFDDGSGSYETVSFTHLERQGNGADGAYKKVINLLTKRA